MAKVDYKLLFKELYTGKVGEPRVITVPKMNFLMLDGKGDPNNSQDYMEAVQTLYPVAYTIKFLYKNKYAQDFAVMPLETLWWVEDMANFTEENKNDWLWTAMIMQPEVVTRQGFSEAVELLRKGRSPKLLDTVRFEPYDEGRAAQVMYIGPYANEHTTILELHTFIHQQGGTLDETNKHHHEIYLSDPRRTKPESLKTIIRQPF